MNDRKRKSYERNDTDDILFHRATDDDRDPRHKQRARAMEDSRSTLCFEFEKIIALPETEIQRQIAMLFRVNPTQVRRFAKIARQTVALEERIIRQGSHRHGSQKKQKEQKKITSASIQGHHMIENMVNHEFGRDIREFYEINNACILGSGVSGAVTKVHHIATHTPFALKTLTLNEIDGKNEDLKSELAIMATLDHPNIVRLVEAFYAGSKVHLIMELCAGGELFDRLVEKSRFSEHEAQRMVRKILSAIRFCHERGIVHRDLKLENILFDSCMQEPKVCDFGLSKVLTTGHFLKQRVGTPYYIAPEVLDGNYDEKCDLWSLGVITYMLLSGLPPFPGETDEMIIREVRRGVLNLDLEEFSGVSPEALNFVRSLLERNPNQRLSAAEALELPWMAQAAHPVQAPLERTVKQLLKFAEYPTLKKVALEMVSFSFTAEEIKVMIPEFQKFDLHDAGEIRMDDFKQALTNLNHGDSLSDEAVQSLFDQMDMDHSGKLSWHEFLAACIDSCKMIDESHLRMAFQHIDKDRKGKIVLEDIRRLMGDDATPEQVSRVFSEIGRQSVDFEDFLALCRSKPILRRLSLLTEHGR